MVTEIYELSFFRGVSEEQLFRGVSEEQQACFDVRLKQL